jgi:hypothetical protein
MGMYHTLLNGQGFESLFGIAAIVLVFIPLQGQALMEVLLLFFFLFTALPVVCCLCLC